MRICMVGPPQPVVMPMRTPQGMGAQITMMFPSVPVTQEAPGCYEAGVYGLDDLEPMPHIIDNPTLTEG